MKNTVLFALMLTLSTTASAQKYMRVWQAGEYTQYDESQFGTMPYNAVLHTITIGGTTYDVAAIDSITMGERIHIHYDGATAQVQISPLAEGVTATVSGAHVVINNSNVWNEQEFVLSGTSAQGSLTYNGQYKATLILDNLNLASNRGAAIDIQCGKRIKVEMAKGSVNTLADAASGTQKAALYCKGHVELAGAGTLNVKGNAAHGIATKEYFQIKKSVGSLNITGSVKDGLHVGQYLMVNGGTIKVTGNKGDAIQVELILDNAQQPDASKELNGECVIKGGSITASAPVDDTSVLKVDGNLTVSGGTLTLNATGAGTRCIDVDGNMLVNQSTAATQITVAASGAKFKDSTGNSSRSRLGKIDGNMTFDAGKMTGTFTDPAKGLKVVGTLTWNKTAGATYTGMGWETGKTVVQ